MFINAVFHLTDPICNCRAMNLSWRPDRNKDNQHILRIFCQTCGSEMVVGPEQFVGGFNIHNPYPDGFVVDSDAGAYSKIKKKEIKLVPSNLVERVLWCAKK